MPLTVAHFPPHPSILHTVTDGSSLPLRAELPAPRASPAVLSQGTRHGGWFNSPAPLLDASVINLQSRGITVAAVFNMKIILSRFSFF